MCILPLGAGETGDGQATAQVVSVLSTTLQSGSKRTKTKKRTLGAGGKVPHWLWEKTGRKDKGAMGRVLNF